MNTLQGYLSNFAELELGTPGRDPGWVTRLRKQAMERFAALGFPTTRLEDWRYTNVSGIAAQHFSTVQAYQRNGCTAGALEAMTLAGASRLVLVDGHFAPDLSALASLPRGVQFCSLAAAIKSNVATVEAQLGRYAQDDESGFLAWNTAFLRDGAFLEIAPHTVVDPPIQIVYVSSAHSEATVSHPRSLILIGSGAQATVSEVYLGLGEDYFANAVSEIIVEPAAHLEHCTVALHQPSSFHVGSLATRQQRDSRLMLHSFSLNGGLLRNEVSARLDGEGSECVLNGLFLGAGKAHIDNQTTIEHCQPHGTSQELYKGILADESAGVFNGRIRVNQGAQKTSARQTNNNLLLSSAAQINTKPQLEIYADDVKCNHGSTIGHLDDDAIFYLRARGIDETTARAMLTYAFASEMTDRLHCVPLRQRLEALLPPRLPQRTTSEASA